ncbi:dATP/dGTP diphosphohydrolase domain-containing protein [Leifsonia sp. Leaf264]|uniref:dATP/dGTP diphosphohydrolase domain-containing protein n=1 Tax=Leifsonia sp. Leaf264 TaxID=1736314 RepID=UPI0006FBBDD5|nr:dATP/dGTP diphosphohydrolase domain-containing protein [Leifsonia sp. Leaf264]KQO98797.1 hypothetical protein ASF30_12100 [Leifsonia sp. Leaf264]
MGAETRTTSSTGAAKGVKKQAYDLIPPLAVNDLAKLYGRGAAKYSPNNFRLGYETSKSYAAAQRHANLFWAGEDLDSETEVHHLSSFVWHCFTIIESNITHPGFDSRPYGAATNPKDAAPLHQIDGVGLADMEQYMSVSAAPKVINRGFAVADEAATLDLRHDLITLRPLAQVAEIFGTFPELAQFGENTYGSYYGQAQAAIYRYWAGEDVDADSGISNLAWAAAYGLLAMELSFRRPDRDDRFLLGAPIGFDSVPVTAKPVEPAGIPEVIAPGLVANAPQAEPATVTANVEVAATQQPATIAGSDYPRGLGAPVEEPTQADDQETLHKLFEAGSINPVDDEFVAPTPSARLPQTPRTPTPSRLAASEF